MHSAWICCFLGLAGALLWLALTAPVGVASLTSDHPLFQLQSRSEVPVAGASAPPQSLISRSDIPPAAASARSAPPAAHEFALAREAEATDKPEPPTSQSDRHLALVRTLGWQNDPAQVHRLTDWMARHEDALRLAYHALISAPARGEQSAKACAAFNRLATSQTDDLVLKFGRPAAARIARSVGIYRADPQTKEIVRVDLDGNVLASLAENP